MQDRALGAVRLKKVISKISIMIVGTIRIVRGITTKIAHWHPAEPHQHIIFIKQPADEPQRKHRASISTK